MKAYLTKPPMGWNSWDRYGASVTEEEVRRNAEYMAANGCDGETYVAQFNVGEEPLTAATDLAFVGIGSGAAIREVWEDQAAEPDEENVLRSALMPHSVKLFEIKPF